MTRDPALGTSGYRAPFLVKLLICGAGIMSLANSMVTPFLAIFLRGSLGLSIGTVGLLLGSSAIFAIVGGFFGGLLADLLGRLRMLVLCLAGVIGSLAAFYFADSLLTVFVANSALALCTSAFSPVGKALIGDLLPSELRVTWFSYQYVSLNVGYAVGPPLGVLAGVSGGRGAFLAGIACYGAYLLVLARTVARHGATVAPPGSASRPGSESQPGSESRPAPADQAAARPGGGLRGLGGALHAMATDRRLLFLLIAALLLQTVHNRISVLLAQYFATGVRDGTAVLAVVITTNALTVVCVQLLTARSAAKADPVRAVTIGGVLTFAGMAGFAASRAPWQFVVAMVVFSVGETFVAPSEFALIDRIAPADLRGSYFGAQTFTSLGGFLGPAVGSLLLARFGGTAMFLGVGSAALLSVAVYQAVGHTLLGVRSPRVRLRKGTDERV